LRKRVSEQLVPVRNISTERSLLIDYRINLLDYTSFQLTSQRHSTSLQLVARKGETSYPGNYVLPILGAYGRFLSSWTLAHRRQLNKLHSLKYWLRARNTSPSQGEKLFQLSQADELGIIQERKLRLDPRASCFFARFDRFAIQAHNCKNNHSRSMFRSHVSRWGSLVLGFLAESDMLNRVLPWWCDQSSLLLLILPREPLSSSYPIQSGQLRQRIILSFIAKLSSWTLLPETSTRARGTGEKFWSI